MATLPLDQPVDTFNPTAWLESLTAIGGGYALMSGRRLAFLVDDCDTTELTNVMAQIVGQRARQEAIKDAIERLPMSKAA